MNNIIIKSFAKVNIGLQVRSKRLDGFHNIHTIFQEISLFDTIKIKKQKKGINFRSNVVWLKNDESNLCIKAYKKLSSIYNIGGINIDLFKNIPIYAGLGGGSSNAAVVLKGVNALYDLKLSNKELELIGSKIGADVPFFIEGKIQLGEGIGEKLTKINKKINGKFLLIVPKIKIDTSWAYNRVKNFLDKDKEFVNLSECLKKDFIPFEFFDNDFEKIIIPAYPEIGKIIKLLRENKARYAGLSGSGSTVFGIFDDESNATLVESLIPNKHKTLIVDPI